jgi:hypothetical protein
MMQGLELTYPSLSQYNALYDAGMRKERIGGFRGVEMEKGWDASTVT